MARVCGGVDAGRSAVVVGASGVAVEVGRRIGGVAARRALVGRLVGGPQGNGGRGRVSVLAHWIFILCCAVSLGASPWTCTKPWDG